MRRIGNGRTARKALLTEQTVARERWRVRKALVLPPGRMPARTGWKPALPFPLCFSRFLQTNNT